MSDSKVLALMGGTVYPDPFSRAISDAVVLIEGDAIAAAGPRSDVSVPAGADIVDCSGCTVLAGFWNSHVHFFERKWADAAQIPAGELAGQLRTFTRFGFTSVYDLSSLFENTRVIRERIEAGEVEGPLLRTTGEGLVPPGALPSDSTLGIMGLMKTPMPEIADARQAEAQAKQLIAAGVDGIKLFASAPPSAAPSALSQTVFQAVAGVAHAAGKPVFVHPNTSDDIRMAIQGGVDVVAHATPRSGAWDDALLKEMRSRDVALIPTLALWKQMLRHDRLSVQQRHVEAAVAQTRAWVERGGTLLFGTDFGAADEDPADEYALMSEAGMSFPQILASLTTSPAQRFGTGDPHGRIAAGYAADIVVLRGDPAADLSALTAVRYTIRSGRVVYASNSAFNSACEMRSRVNENVPAS